MKFNLPVERELLIKNIRYLQSLPPKEYTLQKKWDELQNKIDPDPTQKRQAVRDIWKLFNWDNEQTVIRLINEINPKVVLCLSRKDRERWEIFRRYASTAEFNQTPSRFIRFLVVDDNSKNKGVIGVGALSGDSNTLTPRDKFIGWTKDQRNKKAGVLNHVVNLSTCVPCQPFGTNLLGGKLIAAMATTDVLRNHYFSKFGDILAGMTTTSLYGKPSMYNGIPQWKPMKGLSTGGMPVALDDVIYARWTRYLKTHRRDEYNDAIDGRKTGPTLRVMALICQIAGIPVSSLKHGHERGVYFSSFFENTKDFLCERIKESELVPKPLFTGDEQKTILDWWRPKAIEAYLEKKAEGGLSYKVLFYDDGYQLDWHSFKAKYLKRQTG